jgi:hypothetical protein
MMDQLMQTNNQKYHFMLVKYFTDKPLYLDVSEKNKPNTRKLVEQPWQQIKVEMWDHLTRTLTDICFLEAKIYAVGVQMLIEDFEPCQQNDSLRIVQRALQLSTSFFTIDKTEVRHQIYGRLFMNPDPDVKRLCGRYIKNSY